MDDLPAPKSWSYDVVLTEHVFDKLWDLDLTLAEFRVVLADVTEVIEVTELAPGEAKEVLLNLNWIRPLHVVVVVDDARSEERVITVYEPNPSHWSADYRRRR
ncbi:MAG TPA: hypothetical protein VM142_04205 [Acidimicrobiales bacterium]|nr:hypothetical protein [Acidimicrobiales bacterium]